MEFVCNICGEIAAADEADISREGAPCGTCKSNVRLRALALLVSQAIFGERMAVPDWPQRPDVVGYGISDWPMFAKIFPAKFSYTNTQFDRELFREQPFLDITNPPVDRLATADVITCSEVLEHVVPPVGAAFQGLAALLKPGGALVFSVPYTPWENTREHFPDLHDWAIHDIDDKRYVTNVTREGKHELFTDIKFHGGGFKVLEMRVFALKDIQAHLVAAGFDRLVLLEEDVLKYGIGFTTPWGRPMLARKADG